MQPITKFQGSQLAVQATNSILSHNLETIPLNALKDGKHDGWEHLRPGTYKIGADGFWVKRPKKGDRGLTIDLHNFARFEIQRYHGVFSSIKLDGIYVYAGDQATVKLGRDKVKVWEQFEVLSRVWNGTPVLVIKCKRDEEYWHIDEDGKVRHRNRKEKGFKWEWCW